MTTLPPPCAYRQANDAGSLRYGDCAIASRRITLTIPGDLAKRPLIYELGHKFNVVTNIRRADITPEFGWAVLEVVGDLKEIEACIAWARKEGATVTAVTGDVVEG